MNRPTSVIVFEILNIVFAALGLLGVAISILVMFMPPNLNPKNPALDVMRQIPGLMIYTNIAMAMGAVFTIILGLAGIGLLMFRSWGRTLSIVYVIYAFISMVVGTVINYCFLLPPLLEKQAALPPGPEKAGAMGGIIGIFAGSCIGFIYPIILLIFMYRPNVKAALQKQNPGDQVRF